MIRTFRFWLLAILAISFAACGKEKSIDSTDGEGSGVFRMKIDGTQWTADKVAAAALTADGYLMISGENSNKKSFSITLKTDKPGKFQLAPDTDADFLAMLLDESAGSPVPFSTSFGANSSEAGGIVEITKVDKTTKKISGKFELKVRAVDGTTKTLTEGVIENLSYSSAGDPGTPNPGVSGKYTAKIDGVQWSATLATEANLVSGKLSITGLSNDKTLVLLQLQGTTPGTYTLDPSADHYATLVYNQGAGPTYLSTSATTAGGTVELTKYDEATKKVSGTFTLKLFDATGSSSKTITAGVFEDIPLSKGFPNSAGNSLSVKINGTDWTAETVSANNMGGNIGINGSNITTNKSLVIKMPPDAAVGKHSLAGTFDYSIVYMDGDDMTMSTEGEIDVTEHNTGARTIKGTFHFKGMGAGAEGTSGSFSVKY